MWGVYSIACKSLHKFSEHFVSLRNSYSTPREEHVYRHQAQGGVFINYNIPGGDMSTLLPGCVGEVTISGVCVQVTIYGLWIWSPYHLILSSA